MHEGNKRLSQESLHTLLRLLPSAFGAFGGGEAGADLGAGGQGPGGHRTGGAGDALGRVGSRRVAGVGIG